MSSHTITCAACAVTIVVRIARAADVQAAIAERLKLAHLGADRGAVVLRGV